MVNYLWRWIDQLRWQRLPSLQKLADTLLKHLDRILNCCRTKVRFGVVEAINGKIPMLINRGRGYEKHARPPIEREAHGRHQHRIRRFSVNQEGRVECHFSRIPVESPFWYRAKRLKQMGAQTTSTASTTMGTVFERRNLQSDHPECVERFARKR
jgi:hypothetical protein